MLCCSVASVSLRSWLCCDKSEEGSARPFELIYQQIAHQSFSRAVDFADSKARLSVTRITHAPLST